MELENAFLVKTSHLLRTLYLACHIAWRGILDGKNVGEALSRVEALYKGILQFFSNIIIMSLYYKRLKGVGAVGVGVGGVYRKSIR